MAPQDRNSRKRTGFEDVGRKIDQDLKDIIEYLNGEVVPKVRTQSSSALRKAAEQLQRLADYMDEHRQRPS